MGNSDYLDRLIDKDALRRYLERTLGPAEHLEIEYHREGHSNETLFLEWGDRDLVLRRPPAGSTADSAHDVLREYRVIDALQETNVPVPRTVSGCEDRSVIGSDFYLMERCRGDVLRDEEPDRFATPQFRGTLSERLIDVIADIHTLDPASVGLEELGYPDGYTERQVDRWIDQLEWATERTDAERSVPLAWDVADWLREHVPDEYDHALVHGDYKLDNVMFAPGTPPELVAVFDWEMSTRGDPSMDLGWFLVYWPDDGDPSYGDPFASELQMQPGYPSRRELIDRYETRTGRTFRNQRFYRTFGAFKMVSACEMMYRRYLEGNADNESYPRMRERVPKLAERAYGILDGKEPL
ncbi:Predicted kinase, aminoglycoside phosphotransferase (APT) family [Natronorubrum sediminis]|uniref:Predicted kinase, aminoglycoside phosphotransferase (APT) family n=1 Tax=Natronorubrum sediminis TaxID=640943 RepID=A0A1H6G765_9EURY|nr:phosphotransferase family protein [Natronorubrum sediminis]SEH18173.1 Predicted kinase, aminoglycoside phosphotransferase (APT) family [Natronorubrum sediminis]